MKIRARSHLTTTTLFFCHQVQMVSLVSHVTHFFLSSEMGAAPIPGYKNMHRCRQVRTDPYVVAVTV